MPWIAPTKMRMTVLCTSSIMRIEVANLSCLWSTSQVLQQSARISDSLCVCEHPFNLIFSWSTWRVTQRRLFIWEFRNMFFNERIKMHNYLSAMLDKRCVTHRVILPLCLLVWSLRVSRRSRHLGRPLGSGWSHSAIRPYWPAHLEASRYHPWPQGIRQVWRRESQSQMGYGEKDL